MILNFMHLSIFPALDKKMRTTNNEVRSLTRREQKIRLGAGDKIDKPLARAKGEMNQVRRIADLALYIHNTREQEVIRGDERLRKVWLDV